MGLFSKRRARKEAEAKPAYKQKGFDAGEGTGKRNGSGPNKSGDDNYTPPKSNTPKKRKPNKAVSLEVKKPKDADAPTLGPRTDTKPEPQVKQKKLKRKERKSLEKDVKSAQAAEFRAGKKAERDTAKKAQEDKQKQVTANKAKATKDKDTEKAKNTYKQGEQLGTPKSTKPKPKKVKNVESSKRAGHNVYYSKAEQKSNVIAKGNKRATTNRKAKAASKSGDTYNYIDSKGRETTAKKG
jgi:hypothetical protein